MASGREQLKAEREARRRRTTPPPQKPKADPAALAALKATMEAPAAAETADDVRSAAPEASPPAVPAASAVQDAPAPTVGPEPDRAGQEQPEEAAATPAVRAVASAPEPAEPIGHTTDIRVRRDTQEYRRFEVPSSVAVDMTRKGMVHWTATSFYGTRGLWDRVHEARDAGASSDAYGLMIVRAVGEFVAELPDMVMRSRPKIDNNSLFPFAAPIDLDEDPVDSKKTPIRFRLREGEKQTIDNIVKWVDQVVSKEGPGKKVNRSEVLTVALDRYLSQLGI